MKEINVDDILDKYWGELGLERNIVKIAIKEIVEEVLQEAAENAKLGKGFNSVTQMDYRCVDKSSILKTKEQVKY